jgi:hypothetical protein
MNEQLDLYFYDAPSSVSGLEIWREERKAQIDALARACGLPIGHAVRVSLISGIVLEGRLLIPQQELWIEKRRSADLRLEIGRVDFRVQEVESCVRTD